MLAIISFRRVCQLCTPFHLKALYKLPFPHTTQNLPAIKAFVSLKIGILIIAGSFMHHQISDIALGASPPSSHLNEVSDEDAAERAQHPLWVTATWGQGETHSFIMSGTTVAATVAATGKWGSSAHRKSDTLLSALLRWVHGILPGSSCYYPYFTVKKLRLRKGVICCDSCFGSGGRWFTQLAFLRLMLRIYTAPVNCKDIFFFFAKISWLGNE